MHKSKEIMIKEIKKYAGDRNVDFLDKMDLDQIIQYWKIIQTIKPEK